jgi:hypothetical protein
MAGLFDAVPVRKSNARMMKRASAVPVKNLFAAWADQRLTTIEVARKLGITDKQLYLLAKKHALPKRAAVVRHEIGGCPDDWGEPEPMETLELSPWVLSRIRELKIAGEWVA